MAHMPDIKPEVNKVDDGKDKKKSAGLLGSLFGGGGAGSGAAGGLGGAAAAGGGGLLATKAGLIGLIVIGSAVAGGIGLVGYSAFGPGEGDKAGGNLSLFAPKPKEADPNAPAPVAKDGSSASLNYFAKAAKDNAGTAAPGAGDGAPADQTAGDAAASGDASAAAATAGNAAGNNPINSGGGAGATGSMSPGLSGTKKLGELSKSAGGGASSSASASTKGPGSLLDGINSARGSVGGGFAKGNTSAAASMSARRGVTSRKGGKSGMRQLASVLRDKGSGATYDGGRGVGTSAGSLGEIGPDGGAIGVEGAGAGAGGAQPTSTPNSAPNVNEFEPPAPKPKHMVTPWEKAIMAIQGMMMMAMLLMFIASKIPAASMASWGRWVLGGLMMALGAAMIVLGAKVAKDQKLQGGVGIAAGVGIVILGAYTMFANYEKTNDKGDAVNKDGKTEAEVNKANEGQPADKQTKFESQKQNPMQGDKDSFMGVGLPVLLGGGLVAASMIAMQMSPPKTKMVEKGTKVDDI